MKLSDLLFGSILRVTSWMQLSSVRSVAKFIGRQLVKRNAKIVKITRRNLAECYPSLSTEERDQLLMSSIEHTVAVSLEMGPVWLKPADWVLSQIVEIEGEHYVDSALAAKKGVLIACPHLGNWEVVGLWCGAKAPMTAMYAPPKSAYIADIILKSRQKNGSTLVPTDKTGVIAQMKALKRGEMVGILPDQKPKEGSGVFAPFMGVPAYTMTLVSTLAKKTGATVLMVTALRVDGGFKLIIKPGDQAIASADLNEATSSLNGAIEDLVNIAPQQYQWEYKRFSKSPDGTFIY